MKLIQRHLENIKNVLDSYYSLTATPSHGGTIGLARELIVKHFLSSNLPNSLDFTSGQIFDSEDKMSGQMDIIIHSKSALKLNVATGVDLVPIDSTLAVIECKSSLKSGERENSNLIQAIDSCVRLKKMQRNCYIGVDQKTILDEEVVRGDKAFKELRVIQKEAQILAEHGVCARLKKTPYLLIAFNGPTRESMENILNEYMDSENIELDFMPDLITVLDQKYYLLKNDGFSIRKTSNHNWSGISDDKSTLFGIFRYIHKLSESERFQGFFPWEKYVNK